MARPKEAKVERVRLKNMYVGELLKAEVLN
jgi:hypothetical protein